MQCAVMQIARVVTPSMNIDTALSRLQIFLAIPRTSTFYAHDSKTNYLKSIIWHSYYFYSNTASIPKFEFQIEKRAAIYDSVKRKQLKKKSRLLRNSFSATWIARTRLRLVTQPQWTVELRNGFKNVYNFVKWS